MFLAWELSERDSSAIQLSNDHVHFFHFFSQNEYIPVHFRKSPLELLPEKEQLSGHYIMRLILRGIELLSSFEFEFRVRVRVRVPPRASCYAAAGVRTRAG